MNNSLYTSSKICRTCLVDISDETDVFPLDSVHSNNAVITLKHKLKLCLMELNLKITPNAVICGDCYISVNFIYKFKKQCLQTEEYINDYLQSIDSALPVGNLLHVVQETRKNSAAYRNTNVIKLEYGNVSDDISGVDNLSMVDMNDACFDFMTNPVEQPANEDLLQVNSQNDIDQTENSSETLYECYHCSYITNYRKTVRRHIHNNHKFELLTNNTLKQKLYRCPSCSYTFKAKKFNTSKPFKCKKCKYISTDILGLERIHNKNKRHDKNGDCNCTKCSYSTAAQKLVGGKSTYACKKYQLLACRILEEAYDVIS